MPKCTSGINGIAFSPDGTSLATASWDHTARVWDITQERESLFIPIDTMNGWSMSASYSLDGAGILTDYPEQNVAKVWDAISGKELLALKGFTDQAILQAVYSPDGKMVAGSSEKAIIVWDVKTGRQLVTLDGDTNFTSIAFSPDGTHLASGMDDGPNSGKVII